MGFWNLMVKKDDIIISLLENIREIKNTLNPFIIKEKKRINKMDKLGIGKDVYIILNAPSLKTQDLSCLKGKDIMFVNRGFMHPLYEFLQPKYHVFCDPKMLNGVWPVTWLDEIISKNPLIKILMPVSWAKFDIFKPYKDHILWITWNLPFYNLGVSGACFSFAIYQHYKTIYFTGFDATGIGHEMVKTADSHFYGNDKELENKPTTQFVIDLLMHSRHLHDLNRLSNWCKKRNIKIINLTNGGLLDMFPRDNVIPCCI